MKGVAYWREDGMMGVVYAGYFGAMVAVISLYNGHSLGAAFLCAILEPLRLEVLRERFGSEELPASYTLDELNYALDAVAAEMARRLAKRLRMKNGPVVADAGRAGILGPIGR